MYLFDYVHIVADAQNLFDISGSGFNGVRTPNSSKIAWAVSQMPSICADIATSATMQTCLDAYCGSRPSRGVLSSSFDINKFWTAWTAAVGSRHLVGVDSRAVLHELLNKQGAAMCEDGPPPPGAVATAEEPSPVELPDEGPLRTGNCGYTASIPIEAKAGWLAVLGGILFIAATRAYQFATGSFFIVMPPKDQSNRYDGA